MQNLEAKPYIYIRLTLKTESLSEVCEHRLEKLGVECLQDAGPYEAYGIIADDKYLQQAVLKDPQVLWVGRQDPPSGK